jgi:hypothetical protein
MPDASAGGYVRIENLSSQEFPVEAAPIREEVLHLQSLGRCHKSAITPGDQLRTESAGGLTCRVPCMYNFVLGFDVLNDLADHELGSVRRGIDGNEVDRRASGC